MPAPVASSVPQMSDEGERRSFDIVQFFSGVLKDEPGTSDAAAAIKTVLHFLKRDRSGTFQELTSELQRCRQVLCTHSDGSVASIMSGCDIVKLHMTKSAMLDQSDMNNCRSIMVSRGSEFLQEMEAGKSRISVEVSSRIFDGMKILTHSRSKNVLRALKAAHDNGRRFRLFVTQSLPDESGKRMAEELRDHGLSVTVILDASVGYIMEQIDVVMVGAEGVVENGGIINKIGTYSIGLAAKALKKPLYVLCESYKFVRFYPLNQSDLPLEVKHLSSTLHRPGVNLDEEHPLVDYTPPHLIEYLFTDLGILAPSAVSDTLIKLYL